LFRFFSACSLGGGATVVTVSGRKLVVNGQTFSIKGVNYSPIPVGSAGDGTPGCLNDGAWWSDKASYIADFPLIHQMGANTIRTFDIMNDVSPTNVSLVRAMLDKAQANGLYVIMSYYPDHSLSVTDPPSKPLFPMGLWPPLTRTKIIRRS